jgi:tight adherence protein C
VNIPIWLPVALLAVSAGAITWALLGHAEEKQMARESLKVLNDYQSASLGRTTDLAQPILQRVVRPIADILTTVGRRVTPAGYVDSVRQKFVNSGRATAHAVDRFLAVKVVMSILGGLCILASLAGLFPVDGMFGMLLGIGIGVMLVILPDNRLDARVTARKLAMQRNLPDIMDLLTISVEAGLGFVVAVPGPLSDEFARMMGEVRAGASRADAMRAMEERCDLEEVKAFAMAIIQADAYGISIGRVLRGQAEEMRIRRRQRAQELAQKTPVKMLLPITLCIFPPLLVVILVPAGLQIASQLGG